MQCDRPAKSLEGLFIDACRHDIVRIAMEDDPLLLRQLLRVEEVASCTIWDLEDGSKWLLYFDRANISQVARKPQWSFVPGQWYRPFVQAECGPGLNPEARVWIHGYGLVVATREGKTESLPGSVTPLWFAAATQFGFTDWWREGIPEDPGALLI